jgi:hypothetical protein
MTVQGKSFRFDYPGDGVVVLSGEGADALDGGTWSGFVAGSSAQVAIGIETQPGKAVGFAPLWTGQLTIR